MTEAVVFAEKYNRLNQYYINCIYQQFLTQIMVVGFVYNLIKRGSN
jgi:hypothetical protein